MALSKHFYQYNRENWKNSVIVKFQNSTQISNVTYRAKGVLNEICGQKRLNLLMEHLGLRGKRFKNPT